jgi:hypothetical protein
MVSLIFAGFGLVCPDRRNRNSYDTVAAVGLVTQTEVVNTLPSAPWTWPAAGTIKSVPVNPVASFCAARGREISATRIANATARVWDMATPFTGRSAAGEWERRKLPGEKACGGSAFSMPASAQKTG